MSTLKSAAAPIRLPEFRDVYHSELGYLCESLRRMGVAANDVEDLAHDVFLVVHRRLANFDPSRPLRPWLFGITFRVASQHRRLAYVRREIVDDIPDIADQQIRVDAQMERNEAHDLVIQGLQSLEFDGRAVFVLHELDGVPVAEIARELEISVNTLYTRLRRARRKFSREIRRLQVQRGEP